MKVVNKLRRPRRRGHGVGRLNAHRTIAEADRQKIAKLYLQGYTQEEISRKFGVIQQAIGYHLKVMRERWKASSLQDTATHQEEILARIDLVEKEAWKAWKRGLGPQKAKTLVKGFNAKGPIRTVSISRKEVSGEDCWLKIIQRCLEMKCKIRGLFKEEHNHYNVNINGPLQVVEAVVVSREDANSVLSRLQGPSDVPGLTIEA